MASSRVAAADARRGPRGAQAARARCGVCCARTQGSHWLQEQPQWLQRRGRERRRLEPARVAPRAARLARGRRLHRLRGLSPPKGGGETQSTVGRRVGATVGGGGEGLRTERRGWARACRLCAQTSALFANRTSRADRRVCRGRAARTRRCGRNACAARCSRQPARRRPGSGPARRRAARRPPAARAPTALRRRVFVRTSPRRLRPSPDRSRAPVPACRPRRSTRSHGAGVTTPRLEGRPRRPSRGEPCCGARRRRPRRVGYRLSTPQCKRQ
jgi:hypothetical protein